MTLEKYLQELQARNDAGDTPAPMHLDDYMTLLQHRSEEFIFLSGLLRRGDLWL